MNNRKLELKWYWCKTIANVSTIFWAMETIFFLLMYGWHLKAFTEDEKICDKMVSYGWTIAIILFVLVLIDIIELFIPKPH